MVNLNDHYNPSEVEVESRDFENIPDGEYPVIIESADIGETQGGFPKLELVYQITDGDMKGRKFWDNLILQHSNPQVETISKSTIKKLFVVTSGNPNDTNTDNLIRKGFNIKLKNKARKDDPEKFDYVINISLSKEQWAVLKGDKPKASNTVETGSAVSAGTNWD